MELIDCYICGDSSNKSITVNPNRSSQTYNISVCNCGFRYLNPRPSKEDIGEFYKSNTYHPHSKGVGFIYRIYKISQKKIVLSLI